MKIDDEEALYRLYLREKLEAAEDDVREGRILSHERMPANGDGHQKTPADSGRLNALCFPSRCFRTAEGARTWS